MEQKTKTAQGKSKVAKVHTQTVMAAATPELTSVMRKITRARPGQPTKRTDELIEQMCLDMMCGDSLLLVCQGADMPGYSTVMRWQQEDPTLMELFDKAREMTAYTIDEVNELIARGHPSVSTGDFRRDELLVSLNNQRKRHLNRKRFNEKYEVSVTGEGPFVLDASMLPFSLAAPPGIIDVTPDEEA